MTIYVKRLPAVVCHDCKVASDYLWKHICTRCRGKNVTVLTRGSVLPPGVTKANFSAPPPATPPDMNTIDTEAICNEMIEDLERECPWCYSVDFNDRHTTGTQFGMEGHGEGKVTHEWEVSCECGASSPPVHNENDEEALREAIRNWGRRGGSLAEATDPRAIHCWKCGIYARDEGTDECQWCGEKENTERFGREKMWWLAGP